MRFKLTQTSNPSGEDHSQDCPADPYLPGAQVVDLGEWAYPRSVQYIEVESLEALLALVETHGRFVLHPTPRPQEGYETLPELELYDCRRE